MNNLEDIKKLNNFGLAPSTVKSYSSMLKKFITEYGSVTCSEKELIVKIERIDRTNYHRRRIFKFLLLIREKFGLSKEYLLYSYLGYLNGLVEDNSVTAKATPNYKSRFLELSRKTLIDNGFSEILKI